MFPNPAKQGLFLYYSLLHPSPGATNGSQHNPRLNSPRCPTRSPPQTRRVSPTTKTERRRKPGLDSKHLSRRIRRPCARNGHRDSARDGSGGSACHHVGLVGHVPANTRVHNRTDRNHRSASPSTSQIFKTPFAQLQSRSTTKVGDCRRKNCGGAHSNRDTHAW